MSDDEAIRDERLTPQDAYALMAELGVGYASTAREIHLAGIEAQATRRLDPARARAWADLRNVEKRLVLDLTFATAPRSERLLDSSLPLAFEPLEEPSIEDFAAALSVPDLPEPGLIGTDLPLPVLDIWALAAELLAAETPPPLVLPQLEPLIDEAEDEAP